MGESLLTLSLSVPTLRKGQLVGLVGNCNDDETDDFCTRNGDDCLDLKVATDEDFWDFGRNCEFN